MKRKTWICVMMAVFLSSFAGCGQKSTEEQAVAASTAAAQNQQNQENQQQNEDNPQTTAGNESSQQVVAEQISDLSLSDYDLSVTDRDRDASYEEQTATLITFSNSGATISGSGASVQQSTVTISEEGTYLLRGSCENGQIIISSSSDSKIQLVLDGLSLSSDSCPLLIEQADKVFLTLAEGSETILEDGSSYELTVDDSNVDATIFSKDDLTINGSGSLTVIGNQKHGIVSKDDLVITGGQITVEAQACGIVGKDSVRITQGALSITSGTDGVRSDNDSDTSKGFVWIGGGQLQIVSDGDGIQAQTLCYLQEGQVTIESGGGSAGASTHSSNSDWSWFSSEQTENEDDTSTKGIKGVAAICIVGGELQVDAADDAIHSDGSILISGGSFTLSSGDDGVHADGELQITDGEITVLTSYEGLEAGSICIDGGMMALFATDDGLNAAGGNNSSDSTRRDNFAADSTKHIEINGGYVCINASGDGIDSNGDLLISGGVVLVSGPTDNANGALDTGSGTTMEGGILIAVGSAGMAEGVQSDTQASIYTNLSGNAQESLALCDEDGVVLASFTPPKSYQNVIISTPDLQEHVSYQLVIGGRVADADENGYATQSSVEGGKSSEVIASLSSSGTGNFPGFDHSGGNRGGQQFNNENPANENGMPNRSDGESIPTDMPQDVPMPQQRPQLPQGDRMEPPSEDWEANPNLDSAT